MEIDPGSQDSTRQAMQVAVLFERIVVEMIDESWTIVAHTPDSDHGQRVADLEMTVNDLGSPGRDQAPESVNSERVYPRQSKAVIRDACLL